MDPDPKTLSGPLALHTTHTKQPTLENFMRYKSCESWSPKARAAPAPSSEMVSHEDGTVGGCEFLKISAKPWDKVTKTVLLMPCTWWSCSKSLKPHYLPSERAGLFMTMAGHST